ncbi:hypothetical protein SALBM217S_05689 [Streptomyces griseoloalbus]
MSCTEYSRSCTASTLTMLVPFRVPMSMLPAVGTMERIACGTTIRRSVRRLLSPSAWAASV